MDSEEEKFDIPLPVAELFSQFMELFRPCENFESSERCFTTKEISDALSPMYDDGFMTSYVYSLMKSEGYKTHLIDNDGELKGVWMTQPK